MATIFTTQPVSLTATSGQNATFSATVSSDFDASYLYQWSSNSTPIVGATSSSYTFNPSLADSNKSYFVTVSSLEINFYRRIGGKNLTQPPVITGGSFLSVAGVTDGWVTLNGADFYIEPSVGETLTNVLGYLQTAPGIVSATLSGNRLVFDSTVPLTFRQPDPAPNDDPVSNFFHVLGLITSEENTHPNAPALSSTPIKEALSLPVYKRTGGKDLTQPPVITGGSFLSSAGVTDGWVSLNGVNFYIDSSGGENLNSIRTLLASAPGIVGATLSGNRLTFDSTIPLTFGQPDPAPNDDPVSNFFHVLGLITSEENTHPNAPALSSTPIETYGLPLVSTLTSNSAILTVTESQEIVTLYPKLKIDSGAKAVFNAKVKVL